MRKQKLSKEDLNQYLLSYLNGIELNFDKELECSIIGNMLNDPYCAGLGIKILPEMFCDDTCRSIFKAFVKLNGEKVHAELSTLFESLKNSTEELSAVDLEEIISDYSKTENFPYRVRILVYQYIKRQYFELMRLAPKIFDCTTQDSWIDSLREGISYLEKALSFVILPVASKKELIFSKHWLRKGDEYLNVLQSKYDPTKGYAWLNGKAYSEHYLLSIGYIKDYYGPFEKI